MSLGILSVLPPLLAITVAMATRRVYQSLLLGILVAAFLVVGQNEFSAGFDVGTFPRIAALGFVQGIEWLIEGVADFGHAGVVLFTLLLGGLVALMQRSGAVRGFGELAMRYAHTRRHGQTIAWLTGTLFLAIDDYFHVIASGAIFRPVTDGLRVSREKLAYLIDSTAAPMVILVPISTWVGFILGVADNSILDNGLDVNAFSTFIAGIPFNFYAILTVIFVGVISVSGRDFGPMAKAEQRAWDGQVLRPGAQPLISAELSNEAEIEGAIPRARNLILPVAFLFVSALGMLYLTGLRNGGEGFVGALQNASAELSLSIASFLTLVFTYSLYRMQGLLSQQELEDGLLDGFKGMMPALAILGLAWGIGNAVGNDGGVGLGDFLAGLVGDSFDASWVPFLGFILGAVAAFATGTSFGTFALMVPVSFSLVAATGDASTWLAPALAATLGGAVVGDHCSPISDTTVMSSMAGHSDHIDHVRTQLPYALSIAGIAALGYLMLAITASPAVAWILNGILFLGLVTFLLVRGRAPA